MMTNNRRATRAALLALPFVALAALTQGGCTKPSKANIELRKTNQQLRDQVARLERQHGADAATIRSLESAAGGAPPAVASERLSGLFTTHGLRIGKLTGGADLDRTKPGDEGVKVYVVPTDDTGEKLKAAGSFVVEAFDLANSENTRLGRWEFDLAQTRKTWNGMMTQYGYVLSCPWDTPPGQPDVTLKVTFRDALTGREFSGQQVVKVQVPQGAVTPAPGR